MDQSTAHGCGVTACLMEKGTKLPLAQDLPCAGALAGLARNSGFGQSVTQPETSPPMDVPPTPSLFITLPGLLSPVLITTR